MGNMLFRRVVLGCGGIDFFETDSHVVLIGTTWQVEAKT